MKYVEMYVDEMKSTKQHLKLDLASFRTKLHHVQCVKQTKENLGELAQLTEHYNFCIRTLNYVISIYSKMINKAEMDELDESEFKEKIKEIQRVHAEVVKACAKKSIKRLEIMYIESVLQAPQIEI